MTENTSKKKEEIDLLELLLSIWKGIVKFFKSIIDLIIFLFVFGLWRIHWMLLFVIAGGGLGYVFYLNSESVYSSELIAQPNGFTSVDMANYINDIHDMCERGNKEGIANAFQISLETSEKILNVDAFYFIDVNKDGVGDYVDYKNKFNPADTTKKIIMNRILIRADVLSNNIFQEVDSGLIKYINDNPYLIQVNSIRKNELENLIAQADNEIAKLDSLQNFEYYEGREEGAAGRDGQIVIMNEQQTQLYHMDKVNLLGRKLANQKALELATDPITVIKDFTEFQVEENPKSEYLIKSGFYSAIFGYILLLIIFYRRKIFSYLASKR